MARYPVNFPIDLKKRAEDLASAQGVSLNQFILWAVSEKIGALEHSVDDNKFPLVTHKRGASGMITPILRGTNIRVQTIAIEHFQWGSSISEIAEDRDLSKRQVKEAIAFYEAHKREIDLMIADEAKLAEELYAQHKASS